MLEKIKSRLAKLISAASCIAIIVIGIPAAYEVIPINFRPVNIWDFANSVLLLYLAVLISLITFSNDQGDNQ